MFEKQGRKCGVSGRELVIDVKWSCVNRTHTTSASLDRIDSKLGYTKENVWWIHKDFQPIKMDSTMEDFVARCLEVVEHCVHRKGELSASTEDMSKNENPGG